MSERRISDRFKTYLPDRVADKMQSEIEDAERKERLIRETAKMYMRIEKAKAARRSAPARVNCEGPRHSFSVPERRARRVRNRARALRRSKRLIRPHGRQ